MVIIVVTQNITCNSKNFCFTLTMGKLTYLFINYFKFSGYLSCTTVLFEENKTNMITISLHSM